MAASSGTFMCSHCVLLYMYLRKQNQGMHVVYQCVCYNCYTEVDGTGMCRELFSDTNSQEIVNTSIFPGGTVTAKEPAPLRTRGQGRSSERDKSIAGKCVFAGGCSPLP